MPCSPLDVSISTPDGPSGPSIPGIGIPTALKLPNLAPLIDGMPEDLLEILDKIRLILPSNTLRPQLSLNFGKDVFDGIMKLLDQFMPFLSLYKFFLPVLNMIICIIEVLCALTNPFKLISALKRLFTICLPDLLSLFPVFALILMIISLLLLLLALVEYILAQILKFIESILQNINALYKAFQSADEGILAIANKLGSLLCIFQNLFVLLAIFAAIIQIFKDILSLLFNIPPCQDGDNEDDGCCTPDVCPLIIKNGSYTRNTGILQYYPKVGAKTNIALPLPPPLDTINYDVRQETWQIYDPNQTLFQEFINIVDAHDVFIFPKPKFFPTDTVYTFETDYRQAAYTVDVKMFYDPVNWGRIGPARNIVFKNCVVIAIPSRNLYSYNNLKLNVPTGVLKIAGGQGYEEDGTTILNGYDEDGILGDFQATLNNFLHLPDTYSTSAPLLPTDGRLISNIEYTFKPNSIALMGRGIITAGCDPGLGAAKNFMNNVVFGDVAIKTEQLKDIVNGVDGNVFPDVAGAQSCLSNSLTNLRSNLTVEGVAEFKTSTDLCLNKLKDDTNQALQSLMGIAFDATKSDFSINPKIQFTSKAIKVKVNLREKNGASLSSGLPNDISKDLAQRIDSIITFGNISGFNYSAEEEGFIADLTSDTPGSGTIMVSFDGNIFSKDIISNDLNTPPKREFQKLDYQFIYTPVSSIGDADGAPRRNETDIAIDNKDSER